MAETPRFRLFSVELSCISVVDSWSRAGDSTGQVTLEPESLSSDNLVKLAQSILQST